MSEFQPFILSGEHLDELAGGFGGSAAIHRLVAHENSRRKIFLIQLFRSPKGDDLQAHLNNALAVMSQNEPVAHNFISHPSFGVWAKEAFRAAHYGQPNAERQMMRLGGFAAAIGIKTGHDFTIETATEDDGSVLLPLLGRIALESADQYATIAQRNGIVTISDSNTAVHLPHAPDASAEWWQPTQWLRAEAEGLRLDVNLNDSYIVRDMFDTPSRGRISHEAHQHWQQLFEEAWHILTEHHPHYAQGIAAGFKTIVPLESVHGQGRSVTSGSAFGAAAMTEPLTGEQLACGIVHEFQHSKLFAILNIIDLHKKDRTDELFYAPWRDDPRPGSGLLQGAYAHLAIANFWRQQKAVHSDPASQLLSAVEFARWYEAELRTVQLLLETDSLNATGKDLLAHVQASLADWDNEPLPDGARETARLQALDHELSWRLHNLAPDRNIVHSLADAFQRGESAPPTKIPTTVLETRKGRDFAFVGHRSRRSLASLLVRDKPRFDEIVQNKAARTAYLPHATDVDILLVRGDQQSATHALNERLYADPNNIEAWAGLALIHAQQSTTSMYTQPEVAAAVYCDLPRKVREKCEPINILNWLAKNNTSSL